MLPLLRSLLRHRVRTALTILGVAIGIFTLLVMGALTEHIYRMVDDTKTYVASLIHIATKTSNEGVNPGVGADAVARIRAIPGVVAIQPQLILLMDGFDLEKKPLTFMTPTPLVEGLDPVLLPRMSKALQKEEGRWLQSGDVFQAMVSRRIATKRGLRVGGKVVIRHREYDLVGIYHVPDLPLVPDAIVTYERLREDFQKPSREQMRTLLAGVLPKGLNLDALAASFVDVLESRSYGWQVLTADGVDPDEVAEAIRKAAPEVAVIAPHELVREVERALRLFTLIMLCIGAVSSLVASLLIINTMVMSILERQKEIGIKVAIGASPGQIVREFLLESALIAVTGAVIGAVAGALSIEAVNPWIRGQLETGETIFLVTPRLVGLIFGFALVLGTGAGVYPALRAARLDPVRTLREL